MSFFTGWFESVIRINSKIDYAMQDFNKTQRRIMAAIELAEFRTGRKFNKSLIEKKFNELDKELYMAQIDIENTISKAFDKHFERNRKKEINR